MLVNPGANSAGSLLLPLRTDPPSYTQLAGHPPGQHMGSMPLPSLPPDMGGHGQEASQVGPPRCPAGRDPTTFAEMGIQGVKLKEKVCIIK